jgi:hypothetical protein
MATSDRLHVGDIGSSIDITIEDRSGNAIDLSNVVTVTYILRKPGGDVVTRTASVTGAVTGETSYDTVDGDLDEAGTWKIQPFFVESGGNEWYADIGAFVVLANLENQ